MSQSTEVAAPTREALRPLRDCQTLQQAFQTKELSERIAQSAPSQIKPGALLRSFIQATTRSPELLKVDFRQAVGGFLTLAELGLPLTPTLGMAYMIPFKGRKKEKGQWVEIMTMQIIIGYQGLLNLATRSGMVGGIHTEAVHRGDDFEYEFGTNQFLRHRPKHGGSNEMAPEFVWAIGHLKGDVKPPFEVLPWAKILKTRDGSQGYLRAIAAREEAKQKNWAVPKTYTEAPWVKYPEQMGKKTVLRLLSKMLPMSVELQGGMAVDEPDRGWVDFGPVIDGEASATDGLPVEDDAVDPSAAFGTRSEPAQSDNSPSGPAKETAGAAADAPAETAKRGPGRPPKPKAAEATAPEPQPEDPPPASEQDYGGGGPQADSTAPQESPEPSGFAANVFDHTGDYATDEITSPAAWTDAYIKVLQATPAADREQLRDNNIETMGELLIGELDRITAAEKAAAAPPPQESSPAPVQSSIMPIIEAPAGRDGKADWKAYVELIRQELEKVGTIYPPVPWVTLQLSRLSACPPAQRVQAVKIISERLKAVGQGIPPVLAELIRPKQPPAENAATKPAPAADTDALNRQYIEDRKHDISSFTTAEQVVEYSNRPGLKNRLSDLMTTDAGKALVKEFTDFIKARYEALGGPKNQR